MRSWVGEQFRCQIRLSNSPAPQIEFISYYRIAYELYMLLLVTHTDNIFIDREPSKSIEGIIILVTLRLSNLVQFRKQS